MTRNQTGNTPDPGQPNGAAGEHKLADQGPARQRKPRFLRRLLFAGTALVVLLIILVAAFPSLLGIRAVKQFALDRVNSGIRGELTADNVALGWFSPCSLEGIRVRDGSSREVLSIDRAHLGAGLWSLATGGLVFEELRVDSPKVSLYLDEENNVSLGEAFSSPTPAAPTATESSGALPDIIGHLLATDGHVTVVRENGDTYDVSELNVDLDINTLNKIKGHIHAALDDGSELKTEIEFNDLAPAGAIDFAGASGTGRIWTDRPVDIESLARVILRQEGLAGQVALDVTANAKPGDAAVEYQLKLAGVRAEDALPDALPLDADLSGSVALQGDGLSGKVDLSGTPGSATARFTATRSDEAFAVSVDEIVNAVMTGSDLAMPDFELTATSDVNLVNLDRALPGMLPLRTGQKLTGGQLALKSLKMHGGEAPSVQVDLAVTDVAAQADGGAVHLSPISLVLDAGLKEGQGVRLDRAELTASFAKVVAQGSIENLSAEIDSNLEQMKRELGQVFDLGELDAGGQVACSVQLARADDETISTKLDMTAHDAFFATGEQRYTLKQGRVSQSGRFELADRQIGKVEVTSLSTDLDGAVVAKGVGWFDPNTQGFDMQLDIERANLAGVSALGVGGLASFDGALAGRITATRAGATDSIVTGGQLASQQLSGNGKALFAGDATVNWSDVAVGSGDMARIGALELQAGTTHVTASDVDLALATGMLTGGELRAATDLGELLGVIALAAEMESPPAIGGQLTLDARASGSGDAQKLAGNLQVANLTVGAGEQMVREEKLDLAFDAAIDQAAHVITLGETRLTSGPLTASLSGTVSEYDKTAVADIKGRYDASWPVLMAMLHELAPSTAELVVLEGKSESEFFVRGPLSQPDTTPNFKGATAQIGFGWNSAELAGIPLTGASFEPGLEDGVVTLPVAKIGAAQGAVNIGGQLDLTADDTTLRMPGTTRVLDGIAITPALTREILSRINPFFYHVVTAEGQVNLIVQELVLPLGESIEQHGTGSGQLELVDLRIKPDAFVTELLTLGGVPEAEEMVTVGVKGVDFEVLDGRIHYEDFTLMFPEDFDVKFYGSVAFDDSLDLVVSLPVRPSLLRKLGVTGPIEKYAEVLDGVQVDIPLAGTRQKPELALAKVDTGKLIEKAAKALGGDAANNALEGLLESSDGKSEDGAEKKPDGGDPIGGLLKQIDDKEKQKKQTKREKQKKQKKQ